MKMRVASLLMAAAALTSCETPAATDSSSFYYASSNRTLAPKPAPSSSAAAPVPRGGYAPGSGPTSMPPSNQFIYQQNQSGLFGSRSSSTMIQSSGGVQSYQTIGNMPVYPGASLPGYNPNQPYMGNPNGQPFFVPGAAGNPGYYMNPNTGVRMRVGP